MTNTLFTISLFLLLLGILLIYKPSWILFLNRMLREKVFNDSRILSMRRKSAAYSLVLSLIFFWAGYYSGHYTETKITAKVISVDRLLYQSLQHLHFKQYAKAKLLAERVLLDEPENAEALYHLAAAQVFLNDPKSAEITLQKVRKLDHSSPQVQYLAQYVMQAKKNLATNVR